MTDCNHTELNKFADIQQNSDSTLYFCAKCQDFFVIKPYEIEIQFGTKGIQK